MSDDSKFGWAKLANAEMLAALSAVVIGACALVVAMYEVRIMRADQRSSVLPLVELSRATYRTGRDGSGEPVAVTLTFHAENVGIGPAKVVDFRTTVDGRPVKTWGEAVHALLDGEKSIDYRDSVIKQQQLLGRTIPAGRQIDMFSMRGTESVGKVNANIDRLNLEACFCSVFNDCWAASLQDFGTTDEVAGCEPDSDSFRE